MTEITSIDLFLNKHLNSEHCNEYIRTEAKILNSFFKNLVGQGFQIVSVFDGEDTHKIENNCRFTALEAIFAVDSETSVKMESDKGEAFILCLILGNGDATTIYDHSDLSEELEETVFRTFATSVKTHSQELFEMNWQGYGV